MSNKVSAYREWLDRCGLSDSLLLATCWQASLLSALEEAATAFDAEADGAEKLGHKIAASGMRWCAIKARTLAQGGGA